MEIIGSLQVNYRGSLHAVTAVAACLGLFGSFHSSFCFVFVESFSAASFNKSLKRLYNIYNNINLTFPEMKGNCQYVRRKDLFVHSFANLRPK